MSIENLDKIFHPKSIAVVGASEREGSIVMYVESLTRFRNFMSAGTISKLDEILPPFWSKSNPIDMLGEATPELFRKVVQICLDAKETNGILIMAAPQALTDSTEIAAALVDLLQKNSFPVFTCWLGGADMENGRKIFNQAGIPTFDTPERAVLAESEKMLALGKKLGFEIKRVPEYGGYDLSLDLIDFS